MRFALQFTLAISLVTAALADQLAYVSEEEAQAAAKLIREGHALVTWCSVSMDPDDIEVIRVEEVMVQDVHCASSDGMPYYQVVVRGSRLFHSWRPVTAKSFPRVRYARTSIEERQSPKRIELDLAYAYVPNQEGTFECLGLRVGDHCEVSVEKIVLPKVVRDEVLKK